MAHRVLILSPYSPGAEHHAARRLGRFGRWLTAAGWDVRSVKGAPTPWVPTGIPQGDLASVGNWRSSTLREITQYPKSLANFFRGRGWGRFLIPDATIGWSTATLLSPLTHRLARWADVIVSSSPPESPHLAASFLCRVHNKAHILDMRDGWMDEPLRQELKNNSIRSRIERRLEGHVLRSASGIVVTSPEWRNALAERYPQYYRKIVVVRNAISTEITTFATPLNRNHRVWVYSGRFGGSHADRDPRALLNILRRETLSSRTPIMFRFVGALSQSELDAIRAFGTEVQATGCAAEATGHVSHAAATAEVNNADALMLLCASRHAIPSKLFEYTATGKPILAVCRQESATWNACSGIHCAMRVDIDSKETAPCFGAFADSHPLPAISPELTEDAAKRQILELFLDALQRHERTYRKSY